MTPDQRARALRLADGLSSPMGEPGVTGWATMMDAANLLRELAADPERVPLTDEQAFDMDAVGWAYSKCVVFGLENGSMESAMMMDRLKLMLEHGITGDAK